MRVSTLVILAVLLIGAVGGAVYYFGGIDGFMQWKGGFTPAETPEEALEKFRSAVQQRKYRWAANYCTKEYADLLIKADGPASRIGDLIDKIRDYMINNKLQTDQAMELLVRLDPLPGNFNVQGAVRTLPNEKEATGALVWEPIPTGKVDPNTWSRLDVNMFSNSLTPGIFAAAGTAVSAPTVKLVKQGDHWKLSIDTPAALLNQARYFVDHSAKYESELKTFRTYMMNGRYDSPKSFEGEVLDALTKAN